MKDAIKLIIGILLFGFITSYSTYWEGQKEIKAIEERIENIYGQGDMGYQMKSYLLHGEYRDEMGTEISERDFWESMYH